MTDLPFMSAPEAAEQLNVDESTVRRYCESGKLQAQFERGVWFIDRESVRWQQRRRRLREAIRARAT